MSRIPWLLLRSAPGAAAWNMAVDAALLEAISSLQQPILRLYSWTEPAASFGYSQHYDEIERLTLLRPLVRRPTGGGLVPHDADWTYSLAFPPGHPWYALRATQSYRQVHEWIKSAFHALGVETELAPAARESAPGQCFEGYEQSDVLWRGRKIAGAAQRRTRAGLLIQGSIQPPAINISRADWEAALCAVNDPSREAWTEFAPFADLLKRIERLDESVYSQPSFIRRR